MNFLSPLNTPDSLTLYGLVVARISGLVSSAPILGHAQIPARIKAAMIMVLAMVFFPLLKIHSPEMPHDNITLGLYVAWEALVGITMGLFVQMIFAAVEFSGTIIGAQIGLSFANMIDPLSHSDSGIIPSFQILLATLLFVSLGIHHVFIQGIFDSYRIVPIGNWHMDKGLADLLLAYSGQIFTLGLKLAAPVMVAIFAANIVMGILAKTFPQMNVFMLSFPVNVGLGFISMGVATATTLHILTGCLGSLTYNFQTIFKLIR